MHLPSDDVTLLPAPVTKACMPYTTLVPHVAQSLCALGGHDWDALTSEEAASYAARSIMIADHIRKQVDGQFSDPGMMPADTDLDKIKADEHG